MCVCRRARYVVHGIAGSRACSEGRCAHVDRIGTAVDGFYGYVGGAGRSEQFELCRLHGIDSMRLSASVRCASVRAGSCASLFTSTGTPARNN